MERHFFPANLIFLCKDFFPSIFVALIEFVSHKSRCEVGQSRYLDMELMYRKAKRLLYTISENLVAVPRNKSSSLEFQTSAMTT